jgi:hypothetical protein
MTAPAMPPQAQVIQSPSMQKKTGCGCCLTGCLAMIALSIVLIIAGYFGVRYSTNIIFSDRVVMWSYENIAKPKIEQMLPPTMTPAEKKRVLSETDATLKEFLALPPEEKSVLKKEGVTALYYLSQDQVIPPEKIPHLMQFIQKHVDRIQENPAESPRIMQ